VSTFTDAIRRNLDGLGPVFPGVVHDCPECPDVEDYGGDLERYHDEAREPSFSWSSCDSCGSTLGGDRHAAHAWDADADPASAGTAGLYHLDICTDCLFFHANGDEPEAW
jgi:hypothetical protein